MAEKPLVQFTRGEHRFEVFKEARAGGGFRYAGYVDGVRSVTAERADIAARALLQKHVAALKDRLVTLH